MAPYELLNSDFVGEALKPQESLGDVAYDQVLVFNRQQGGRPLLFAGAGDCGTFLGDYISTEGFPVDLVSCPVSVAESFNAFPILPVDDCVTFPFALNIEVYALHGSSGPRLDSRRTGSHLRWPKQSQAPPGNTQYFSN